MNFPSQDHRQTALVFLALIALQCAPTFGNDDLESVPANDLLTDTLQPVHDGATSIDGSRKPYTATLTVDTRTPVSYGENVVISVWITPLEGWDLSDVRIHPKGALATIYRSSEDVEDAFDGKKSVAAGEPCRTETRSRQKGVPFVAICQLTSLVSGWRRWVDTNTLLGGSRQQFEVEISIEDGGKATYYEFGSADFVSPISAVILGGFVGAMIWSMFLQISAETSKSPQQPLTSWSDVYHRIQRAFPRVFVLFWLNTWGAFRTSLLGGVTALILIVLASSTDGFEPPISLRIQDFWGGMLVGILSTPLSKWIQAKITTLVPAP